MKKVFIMSLMLTSQLTHLVKLEASQSGKISVWEQVIEYGDRLEQEVSKFDNKDAWVMKLQRYTHSVEVHDNKTKKDFWRPYVADKKEAIDAIHDLSKTVRSIDEPIGSDDEKVQRSLLHELDRNVLKIAPTEHNTSLVKSKIDLNWAKKTRILMGLGAIGMSSVAFIAKPCEQLVVPIAAVSGVTFLTGLYLNLCTTKRTANSKFEYSPVSGVVEFTGYDFRAR